MPNSNRRFAILAASSASPSMIGTIGCSPATMSCASRQLLAKVGGVRCQSVTQLGRSTRQLDRFHGSAGHGRRQRVGEQVGRDRWRSNSIISRRPLVYPPLAPPIALPSVPVVRSIRSTTPRYSCVPRPVAPTKPVAWQSSKWTSAPYWSANSQIASSRAI